MNEYSRKPISRRGFLRAAGLTAAGTLGALSLDRAMHLADPHLRLAAAVREIREITLAFTDGWVSMPEGAAPVPPFFPDPGAPQPFTTYVMGIRDLSHVKNTADLFRERGKGQISAPLLWADEGDDVRLSLWNLGLSQRPDLIDSHTVHWHGFPNQIAYFDGVPDASLSTPIGRRLVYRYIPQDPGTYMYHCHVEDVEHVHMGLTGLVFVRPALNKKFPGRKFAYNVESTEYDREFSIFLSEINSHAHFNDAHKQDTDWTDYNPDFALFNGRAYPDTVAPAGDPTKPDAGRLRYQPISSLIQANEGERVLVRLANLGFKEHSLLLPNLPITVIGRDAKPMVAGRPNYIPSDPARGDVTNQTYRIDIGPGESRDVLFVAPSLGGQPKAVFPFYDRNYGFAKSAPGKGDGYGGMRTEVRIYPKGTLPAQTEPHQTFPAQ